MPARQSSAKSSNAKELWYWYIKTCRRNHQASNAFNQHLDSLGLASVRHRMNMPSVLPQKLLALLT